MMQRLLLILIIYHFISNYAFSGNPGNIVNSVTIEAKFKLSDGEKCTDCHNDLISLANTHPIATDDCEACHQIKIIEHKDNAQKGLNLAEKLPDLCYSCHDNIKSKFNTSSIVHKAVNDSKNCVVCHNPHSSAEKKILVSAEKDLCLSCHNTEMKTTNGKIANIQLQLKNSKSEHAALADGCISCHNPHAANNSKLLNKAFPGSQYIAAKKENFELCFDCHDAELLEKDKTTSATGFRNGAKNLHFVHINGEKGRTCTVCHNIHASENNHLIQPVVIFGSWNFKMNYKSDDKGGSCLPACHSEQKYSR